MDSQSDPSSLSVALCQLVDRDFTSPRQRRWGPPEFTPVKAFIGLYKERWDFWHDIYRPFGFPDDAGPCPTFHYHLRLMSASRTRPSLMSNLTRESGSIRSSNIQGRLFVCEKRIAVAVRTTCNLDLPVFSQVVLADSGPCYTEFNISPLDVERLWSDTDIRPSVRSTAISAFAVRLHGLLSVWSAEWDLTLCELDSNLRVEVGDTSNARAIVALRRLLPLTLSFSRSKISFPAKKGVSSCMTIQIWRCPSSISSYPRCYASPQFGFRKASTIYTPSCNTSSRSTSRPRQRREARTLHSYRMPPRRKMLLLEFLDKIGNP